MWRGCKNVLPAGFENVSMRVDFVVQSLSQSTTQCGMAEFWKFWQWYDTAQNEKDKPVRGK